MVKRNDVVAVKQEHDKDSGGFWRPFGRVNKILSNGQVEIITVLKDVELHPAHHLEVVDYKGFWHTTSSGYEVFIWMPSLRKLKQLAQIYHPEVWKRPKRARKV